MPEVETSRGPGPPPTRPAGWPAGDGQQSRRARILAEAARLFAERGYGSTSLNDLAGEAGIAKPTLFHYFSSKQEILFSLYQQTMELALERMRGVLQEGADPYDNVAAVLRTHTLLILEYRELFTIFFDEEGALSTEQYATIREQQRSYIHLISTELRKLQSQGRMRSTVSPNIAVQGLLGMANWVYKWYDPDGPLGEEAIAAMLSDIGLRGVINGPSEG